MNIFRFKEILKRNNLDVSDIQLYQLENFVKLLIDKNKSINLISRKDLDNIWEKHILHSLSLLFYFNLPSNINVLDVGTGGGLPGIPIKILCSDIRMDLVDSIQKKTNAVQEFVKILKLKNINVFCQRVEKLNRNYDLILGRGVTDLKTFYKWTENLLDHKREFYLSNKNSQEILKTPLIILYKGGKLENEIKKLKLYNYKININEINIAFQGIDQNLLIEKKLVILKD